MTGYNELRDGQEFYGNGYKKGYEDAKKEYARPQGEWISVKDKLPDKKGRCLVFTNYGDVTMDSFIDGMFVCNLGNVTHWRPLPPKPYESEQRLKKLVIEIDDEVYKTVQDGTCCGSLYEELKAARPYDKVIDEVTELLENEWGYEDMRDDVSRIMRGGANDEMGESKD